MSHILDGIEQLTSVTRGSFERTEVDLSALARQMLARLASREPARRVECVVQDDMLVSADRNLVRQLLGELLGNAWKFTSARESARIEVGSRVPPSHACSSCTTMGSGSIRPRPRGSSLHFAVSTPRTS
jgi:signal transduction histidine kinase